MLGCTGERKQIFELAFGQGLTKMYKCTNIASPQGFVFFLKKFPTKCHLILGQMDDIIHKSNCKIFLLQAFKSAE